MVVDDHHCLRGDQLPTEDNNKNNNNHNDDGNENHHDTAFMMGEDNSTTEKDVENHAQDEQGEERREEHEQERQGQGTDTNPSITGSEEPNDHDDSFLPPPLPDRDDSSLLLLSSEDDGDHELGENQTFLEEKEMRRKLMDMESSFLPEPSTMGMNTVTNEDAGVDDTYLVGVPEKYANAPPPNPTQPEGQSQLSIADETSHDLTSIQEDDTPAPQTPRQSAGEGNTTIDMETTTPAGHPPKRQHGDETTILENPTSSPAARAAAKNENRNLSASVSENTGPSQAYQEDENPSADKAVTPQSRRSSQQLRTSSQSGKSRMFNDSSDGEMAPRATVRRGNRPKYLNSRQSAQRLSYSSIATTNTEATHSDATLGADYALQSGGAAPDNGSDAQPGQHGNLARSVSLGSVASGVSGYSDENSLDKSNKNLAGASDNGLHTLSEEEGHTSQSRPSSRPAPGSPQQETSREDTEDTEPMTPKAKPSGYSLPTDTAITERIKDIQVPSAFSRQFREEIGHRALSPERRTGATSTPAFGRSGRSMTLKEQSSTIDRLSKENFDLKMRIHFLNEALNKRSEEGIKEMVSENVELKSDKLKLQKDNQGLKRKVRDLEKQIKDQQSDKESMVNHDPEGSDDEHRDSMQNEEILFLQERMESYELEIERLRSESIARESEKRRLAEMVKSLSNGRPVGSDFGSREERVSKLVPVSLRHSLIGLGYVEGYA